MKNRVCDMFGMEFPIFAFSHCRDVVAAVTNAGGMGVFGALGFGPEQLEIELKWIDEHVNGKPYAVDVVMPVKTADREAGLNKVEGLGAQLQSMITQEHFDFVDRVLDEFDIPRLPEEEAGGGNGGGRRRGGGVMGWTEAMGATQIEIALSHPIAMLASALGPPPRAAIEQAQSQGVKVGALIGRVSQAERDVREGVDLIIAQGYEAGGHTGEVASMVLVPDVVDAVHPIPVLAAGGIGTGRQMAAAMSLGAEGVWTGSIWLTVTESNSSPVIIEKLIESNSTDTVRSRALTGKPARQLRTTWTEIWERPDSPGTLPMPLQNMLHGYAYRRISPTGRRDFVGTPVGQIVSRMNQVRTSKEVVYDLVEGFLAANERLNEQLSDVRV